MLIEYKRLAAGHAYPMHRHPRRLFELYVVLAGSVRIRFADGRSLELREGQAMLLPPSPDHAMESPGGGRVVNLHFPLANRPPWREAARGLGGRPFTPSRLAMEALRRLVVLDRGDAAFRPYLAHALVTAILLDRVEGRELPPAGAFGASTLAARVEWVVERHLAERLTNRELARHLNLGLRTLETRYRREAGVSLHATITRLRLERATGLLAAGERSVKRVALESGFRDPAYFIRVFRRAHGLTPGTWQREWEDRSRVAVAA